MSSIRSKLEWFILIKSYDNKNHDVHILGLKANTDKSEQNQTDAVAIKIVVVQGLIINNLLAQNVIKCLTTSYEI